MGAIEQTGKVASGVVDGLKQQPLALALVVVNVLYLAAGGWFLSSIGDRAAHRDTLIEKLAARECPRGE